MRTIGVKELKQNASQVLRDVEAHGSYVVTVAGRPVATLAPIGSEWVSSDELRRRMGGAPDGDWGSEPTEWREASPEVRDPWESRETRAS